MPRNKRVSKGATERLGRVGKGVVHGLKEAAAHARGEISLRRYEYDVPGPVNVKAIRAKLGLSQSQFARCYGFSARTSPDADPARLDAGERDAILLAEELRADQIIIDEIRGSPGGTAAAHSFYRNLGRARGRRRAGVGGPPKRSGAPASSELPHFC